MTCADRQLEYSPQPDKDPLISCVVAYASVADNGGHNENARMWANLVSECIG